jgi:hypothetical protein
VWFLQVWPLHLGPAVTLVLPTAAVVVLLTTFARQVVLATGIVLVVLVVLMVWLMVWLISRHRATV